MSTSSGIFAVTLFILIGSISVAAILGSYVFVGLGLLLAVAYNHWAWEKAELWPTFPDAAAAENRASWWVTVASFLRSSCREGGEAKHTARLLLNWSCVDSPTTLEVTWTFCSKPLNCFQQPVSADGFVKDALQRVFA
ncbi:hypothetical protein LP417_19190 [Polaromonas sp. P1-6]|nr:hypothetical protein LP417_19190 [Polaromonas sp. P1-6]